MQYILDNKEWIFSGIGVLVVSTIIGIILYNVRKKREKGNTPLPKEPITKRTVRQYGEKSLYIKENKGDITIN